MVALEALPWRGGGYAGYGGYGGYRVSYGKSLNQAPSKLNILAFPLLCFKVVTAGEEVMVTVMEEDTAEVIGVEVTQIWQFEI